jgi:hypothetical protein
MAAPPTATLEIDGGVAVITLLNPPVNALHPDGEGENARRGSKDARKKNSEAASHVVALHSFFFSAAALIARSLSPPSFSLWYRAHAQLFTRTLSVERAACLATV